MLLSCFKPKAMSTQVDVYYPPAIHNYCIYDNVAGVEWCLAQDPSILNKKNAYGETPLTCALFNGSEKVADYLMQKFETEIDAAALLTALDKCSFLTAFSVLVKYMIKKGKELSEDEMEYFYDVFNDPTRRSELFEWAQKFILA